MSKKFILITGILSFIGMAVEWGMGGIMAVLGAIIDISLIALFVTIVRIILRRNIQDIFGHFLRNFLFCGSILGVISFLLIAFAAISNSFPGSLSAIHLTDGKRQIVFMQMSHIGTQEYYTQVNRTLQDLTSSGYIIYREGVRPGTKENTDRFDQALGVKISSGTYADFASFMGLVAQDDTLYSGTKSGSIRPVDLTLDEIVTLMGTGKTQSSALPIDPTVELEALRNTHTGPLLGYILRGILNLSLSYAPGTDILLESMEPTLRDGILTKRNQHLVDTFLTESATEVVIVYGALHFEGVFQMLRSKNPEWKILSVEPYYPYKK